MHPFVSLGSITLPSYGLCTLAGTLMGLVILFTLQKKSSLTQDNLLDALIWSVLLGLLGAKLLYFITEPPTMPTNWEEWKLLLTSGLVFYGGLIGGIMGAFLASKKIKKSFFTLSDIILPCLCFAHAGGRVGCLMAGCCYGMECEGAFCVVLDGTSRLATQLMEAGFLVILGSVLAFLYSRHIFKRGFISGLYLLGYSVWRFIIEFFRDDPRGSVGPFSTSQFISLFLFAAGVALLIVSRKWDKDPTEHEPEPMSKWKQKKLAAQAAKEAAASEEETRA